MKKIEPLLFLCLLGTASAVRAQEALAPVGTLAKIKQTRTLALSHRSHSSPFSYVDALGRPTGYAKDLCDRIADEIKRRLDIPDLVVRYHLVTPQNRAMRLRDGTVDLECGSSSEAFARREKLAHSIAYFVSEIRMLSRVDAGVNTFTDLDGKTVATTANTTSVERIMENLDIGFRKIAIRYGLDHAESFMMVKTGVAAAFIMDDVILMSMLSEAKDPKAYTISRASLGIERYVILMREGDEMMKNLVDATLAKLMRTDEAERIYARWFLRPIPPRDVNLNLPMSPALRKIFEHPDENASETSAVP